MSFAARIAVERPQEIALRDPQRSLGWQEVDDVLDRAASLLLDSDLGAQGRIAVFAENSTETLLTHLAGLLGGASVVPVNFHLAAPEAAYILQDAGVQILFVGPENLKIGLEAAAQAGVPRVIGWRCPPSDRLLQWSTWLAEATGGAPPVTHPPRPNLMYTSGTTGVPKGTELPPTMFAGGDSVAEFQQRLTQSNWCKYGRHLVVGPLYHTGPLGAVRILGGGVPVTVLGRFDAEATLAAIERDAIESTVMVPTHFVRLLALPTETHTRYDVSSLAMVYHTGAACPIDVKKEMLTWWGPVIYEAYGATEVGTTCRIGPEEWLAHPGSVGRPSSPFEALIVDEDGEEVCPGTTGRIYFRDASGRGVIYHKDPAKSQQAHLRPGVFTLGEIGHVDEDGYLYITDRFSDMILSGGVNVYPAEAEKVLAEHPEIRDVVCIGIPHPEMGEQLLALVQAKVPGRAPEAESLLAYCRDHLSSYKCPRLIEFREDLARNAMGKVDKRSLRQPYWT